MKHFWRTGSPPMLLVAGVLSLLVALAAVPATAGGNQINEDFSKTKVLLEKRVYYNHRITFYCGATFDAQKNITLPKGFSTPEHAARARKVEWEHIVPAENFGRTFKEWREGAPQCVQRNGKAYKGRKCAEKANKLFRYMLCDMYNLYPAIGAVNAMRSNFNFKPLPAEMPTFGSCEMKIADRSVEPPSHTRGAIARTYKYMQNAYAAYTMSHQQQQLMDAWDAMHPVDVWECTRAKRIEKIQRNENRFVKAPCQQAGLWPTK